MRKPSVIHYLLPLLLLQSLLSFADDVDELMQQSGINQQIEQIEAGISPSLQEADGELPSAIMQKLEQVMLKEFAADNLKLNIRQQLQSHLSRADIKAVMKWLNSPLGKKITALEVAQSSEAAYADSSESMDTLLADSERFTLMRELNKATGTSDAMLAMTIVMQEAMFYGMKASAKHGELDDAVVQHMLSMAKQQLQTQMELMAVSSLLYTYRDLSVKEIKHYIDFANSPAGKNYHQAFIQALSTAMTKAGGAVGKALAESP